MNAIGATLTLICTAIIFLAPRRWAALGVIAAMCYITQGQQLTIAGFHFTAIRFALLAGIIRAVVRGEFRNVQFNPIDKALMGYAISMLCIGTARERTSDMFIFLLGCTYDIVLSYFVFRSLVSSLQEANEFFQGVAVLIIPLAILMVGESWTGQNIFRTMGGQGWEEAVFREGRARSVASFRGPHTAGIFGATLFPIFAGLWLDHKTRATAILGLVASGLIMYSTNSSGPLLAFLAGVVALAFWPMQERMQTVRRGIVFTLIALHLTMKAPVWYVFSKISDLTGGDGWTRSFVLDRAINYFTDWWLIGTSYTGTWLGDPSSQGQLDLTDSYVATAAGGGLLGLGFFILLEVRCFRYLGRALQATRSIATQADPLVWGLGSALFAHVVGLFSVGYFDQVHVAWWGLLAIIASATSHTIANSAVTADTMEPAAAMEDCLTAEPPGSAG